ncbi:S41 family peptidase [Paracoccus contaminans]|uniref:Peptidase S41 n=1 Tax=Paracoccus contaminans TaxID=1945662 RepID=A0A1W6CXN7_9RHOB|nr:S41 family peptidase [Paracoccus contaminans]ARJ69628.1 peptidase S41 [Paracoccus contaminans]
MKRYIMAGIGGTLAGLVLTTQLAGPLLAQDDGKDSSVYDQLDLFGNVFERVQQDYVEEVDAKTLIEAAINGMLTSLDPHSSFLAKNDYQDMQEQTRGSFGGLGIEVGQEDGLVKVISPMDDTPAAKAGIKPGDFISHVNGESLMGLSLDEAVDKMRGAIGSEVTVTILRKGEKEPFDVKMTRETIKLTVVKSRVEGHAVVLRIATFNDETYDALKTQLEQSVKDAGGIAKVTGFVIDLRNNPGGLLEQAIKVSDAFLDRGEITSTRGRNPEDNDRWNATAGDLAQGKPMVVLINGGSASASEIVTGALQDHRRAIVVGTKSFGKGSVQTVVPVTSDSAIRLTTARYYTPSGRSIQALGINPDIIVQQPPAKPADADAEDKPKSASNFSTSESDLRGALNNDAVTDEEKRQIEEEARQVEATAKLRDEDYQLAYAVDILKGLAAVDFSAADVAEAAKPAVTGQDATSNAAREGASPSGAGDPADSQPAEEGKAAPGDARPARPGPADKPAPAHRNPRP